MTAEQFNDMKGIMEFDLSIYLPTMVNSGIFNHKQILEMGAYVAASYTHFSKTENIFISEHDKENIKDCICSFYNQCIRQGISEIEKSIIRIKYDELLNVEKPIITAHLEKIANLAVR